MNFPRLLTIAVVGLAAQLVDGTLGMGYGVTSATLLVSFGLAPLVASASVHMAETVSSLGSGLAHLRFGNVERRLFLPLAVFGVAGGVAGAVTLVRLSVSLAPARRIVSVVLLMMGCLILWRYLVKDGRARAEGRMPGSAGLGFTGFAAAFVDALGGGGWGPIAMTSLVLGDVEPRKAVGSVDLAEFFVTVCITATFILMTGFARFRWDVAAALAAGGLVIAPLAALLCRRVPPRALGIGVGLLLILINLRGAFLP